VAENSKTNILCSITCGGTVLEEALDLSSDRIMNDVELSHKNCAVCKIIWKNMVETDRPQMTVYCGTCALHAG
jgi:hypothetical protein